MSKAHQDSGFTLMELLIVMVIIGILAGIAIPMYNAQQEKAHETAMRSDLRSAASLMTLEVMDAAIDQRGEFEVSVTGETVTYTTPTGTEITQQLSYPWNEVAIGATDDGKVCIAVKSTKYCPKGQWMHVQLAGASTAPMLTRGCA